MAGSSSGGEVIEVKISRPDDLGDRRVYAGGKLVAFIGPRNPRGRNRGWLLIAGDGSGILSRTRTYWEITTEAREWPWGVVWQVEVDGSPPEAYETRQDATSGTLDRYGVSDTTRVGRALVRSGEMLLAGVGRVRVSRRD